MATQFRRIDSQAKRIMKITFKREADDCPDLSYLGEYQSSPGDPDKTIDRKERGEMGRNEHRYFVAAMSGEETGNPESVEQDYKRSEDYGNGWYQMYLRFEALVSINGIMQTVTSGGIGGVESDSDESHFDEIREEEKDELAGVLQSMGFSEEQITTAFQEAKEE